jgi:hypothetical protein
MENLRMNKRNIIKLISVGVLTLALSGFKLPTLGGGGDSGGGDWKAIAGDFNSAFQKISQGMSLVLDGIVESQKAIGIKTTAAIELKNETDKIKSGSAVPVEMIEKQTKYIKSATEELASAIASKTLTAKEKAALAAASANYFKGAVSAVPGYIKVFITFKSAQKAGTPKPMDLMGAAKDIPTILSNAPAMFEMIPVTYDAFQTYQKSLKAANIEIPAATTDAIAKGKSDLMSGMAG